MPGQIDRVAFIKKANPKIDISHDPIAAHKEPAAIIDHFAQTADPTPRKVYLGWIVRLYKKKTIRQEDCPRVRRALIGFERYKAQLELKDINQYARVAELEDAVEALAGKPASNKEVKREVKSRGADCLLDVRTPAGRLTVHALKTFEASIQYGANTKWCTTGRNARHLFSLYSGRGTLYVIGVPGRKWQYQPSSGQLMDERDESYSASELVREFPQLKTVAAFRTGNHVSDIAFVDADELPVLWQKFARSPNDDTRRVAASVSHDIAKALINDPSINVRCTIAQKWPDLAEYLMYDRSEHVRANVAAHHRELAGLLFEDDSEYVRAAVARHGRYAALFIDDPGESVRRAAAQHEHLAPMFVDDPSKTIRMSIVRYAVCAPMMVDDVSADVRRMLVRAHPALAHKLVTDPSVTVRVAVARYLNCAARMVDDRAWQVRRAIAIMHPGLARKLVHDKSQRVREAAGRNT